MKIWNPTINSNPALSLHIGYILLPWTCSARLRFSYLSQSVSLRNPVLVLAGFFYLASFVEKCLTPMGIPWSLRDWPVAVSLSAPCTGLSSSNWVEENMVQLKWAWECLKGGSTALGSVSLQGSRCRHCWFCLGGWEVSVAKTQLCASLPNSAFSDVQLVLWLWPG